MPIIGDDIKSQVGATISHRILTSLFRERGVHLDRTMQLNVGGNSDFLNMLERDRLESKKISKTNAVTSMLDYDLGEKNVHVGPSDYVPWLTDRKWAYIRMEGTSFGDVPLNIELKLEVWDSPNSAGIVIDAVRLAKLALNNGIAGALEAPSSYLMKSPPVQIVDSEAHENTERFITKNALKPQAKTKTTVIGDASTGSFFISGRRRPRRRRPGGRRRRAARRLLGDGRPDPRHARGGARTPAAPRSPASPILERGRPAVGLFLAATAPVCFLLLLPAIWSVFDESGDDTVWRWAGSAAIVVLGGLLLGTALLMARTSTSEVIAYATGALAGIAGTLTIAAIWAEPNADGWVQLIAALWILAVLGYVLVPLVGRFGRPALPSNATHLPARERVLATLDGVELVASTSGTVEPRLAPGEQLLLRRRTSV